MAAEMICMDCIVFNNEMKSQAICNHWNYRHVQFICHCLVLGTSLVHAFNSNVFVTSFEAHLLRVS